MRRLFYRVVGPPPGKGAPAVEQLRWVRRILVRWATPLMISACILLIVIGGLVIPAIVFAALQAWSVVSLSMRIRREDDSRA